jgi:hypothetical protein
MNDVPPRPRDLPRPGKGLVARRHAGIESNLLVHRGSNRAARRAYTGLLAGPEIDKLRENQRVTPTLVGGT